MSDTATETIEENPVEEIARPRRRSTSLTTGAKAVGSRRRAVAAKDAKAEKTKKKSEKARRDSKPSAQEEAHAAKQSNHRRQRKHHDQQKAEPTPSITREDLSKLKVVDLRAKAQELEIDPSGLKKAELVDVVFEASVKAEGFAEVEGILDVLSDGYGFLRTEGYLPGDTDCYVSTSTIRRNGLRKGDKIVGQTRPPRDNEKYAAIQTVLTVNDIPVEEIAGRKHFSDLTPVYPDERLLMEHGANTLTARVIDLVAPIGKGQRGLIVSPPKAGKTTILKDIAASISANNPEVYLMCLLVDERPEEVTDMERSIKGEVISSTFDMPSENHIAVAELVIERAKRLVECGRDVVILLDSITRLARAYNLAQPASGRILSGGVDSTALYPPKRFLGAARNIEFGGSLTILASALIETGSKMDEVIFEEFKGTGNMELRLDRELADRRIFPAIDPVASGTRKEELLMDPQEAPLIWAVRRILANMNNVERAMDMLIKSLKRTDTNQEFLIRTARKAQHSTKDDSFEI
ncbi:MAG: transcription termination factor Rho [Eggerthellaceae bacterium]|jgi:transcription termination factor Rho